MKARAFIGIMSCVRDAQSGCHDVIRATWLKRMVLGLEYRFFVGRGEYQPKADEVRLDVDDDYAHLPEKSQAMRRWALDNHYDCHFFKCDRDSYVHPQRLLNSGFERHQYLGHFPGHPIPGEMTHESPDVGGRWPYASGGAGYWTGPKANRLIAEAPIDEKRLDMFGNPAEDLWIPNILRPEPNCIRGWHDPRYQFKGPYLWAGNITVHLGCGTGTFVPAMMVYAHQVSL